MNKNAKLFAAEKERFNVIKADAMRLPQAYRKYDMVFMDAPYAKGQTEQALTQLLMQNWLGKQAVCIVEVRNDERFLLPEVFELLDERVYGLARVLFLRYC